jgi:predicted lipoprotein with Yx(FWY)xxD motif
LSRRSVAIGATTVAAGALIMTGCGSAHKPAQSGSTSGGPGQPAQSVQAQKSSYGTALFDGQRRALYLFTRDGNGPSQCSANCAARWPPFIVSGTPSAGQGVHAGLLSTRKRSDGTVQATYAGKPLYYYIDDKPGQILCQGVNNFGGLWYVLKPDGTPVR